MIDILIFLVFIDFPENMLNNDYILLLVI